MRQLLFLLLLSPTLLLAQNEEEPLWVPVGYSAFGYGYMDPNDTSWVLMPRADWWQAKPFLGEYAVVWSRKDMAYRVINRNGKYQKDLDPEKVYAELYAKPTPMGPLRIVERVDRVFPTWNNTWLDAVEPPPISYGELLHIHHHAREFRVIRYCLQDSLTNQTYLEDSYLIEPTNVPGIWLRSYYDTAHIEPRYGELTEALKPFELGDSLRTSPYKVENIMRSLKGLLLRHEFLDSLGNRIGIDPYEKVSLPFQNGYALVYRVEYEDKGTYLQPHHLYWLIDTLGRTVLPIERMQGGRPDGYEGNLWSLGSGWVYGRWSGEKGAPCHAACDSTGQIWDYGEMDLPEPPKVKGKMMKKR